MDQDVDSRFALVRYAVPFRWLVLAFTPALASCIGVPPAESLDGYELELLPEVITASYVRGNDVYLGVDDGRIMLADDRDLARAWQDLGNPLGFGPRLVFASWAGVLFVSADHQKLWRAAKAGEPWKTRCSGSAPAAACRRNSTNVLSLSPANT